MLSHTTRQNPTTSSPTTIIRHATTHHDIETPLHHPPCHDFSPPPMSPRTVRADIAGHEPRPRKAAGGRHLGAPRAGDPYRQGPEG
jgi:hypothetical protein